MHSSAGCLQLGNSSCSMPAVSCLESVSSVVLRFSLGTRLTNRDKRFIIRVTAISDYPVVFPVMFPPITPAAGAVGGSWCFGSGITTLRIVRSWSRLCFCNFCGIDGVMPRHVGLVSLITVLSVSVNKIAGETFGGVCSYVQRGHVLTAIIMMVFDKLLALLDDMLVPISF